MLALPLLGVAHAAPLTQRAQQSPHDPLRITAVEGGWVRVTQAQGRTAINLQNEIHGCTAQLYDSFTGDRAGLGYSLRVIEEVQRGGFWYLVLQADSNPNCNVQGECGAGGPNTDLIWLKLNRRLEVVAKQAENLADCQTGRTFTLPVGSASTSSSEDKTPNLELCGGVLGLRVSAAGGGGYGAHQAAFGLRYLHAQPWRGLIMAP